MGKSLAGQSAAARALYDEANSVLGWDLAQLSFEGPEAELTQTKVCQPALFVHGMALLSALQEAGKLPAGEPELALCGRRIRLCHGSASRGRAGALDAASV